nr:MAG TPA: hypothetical protein [Caudoviricetes sp.]
MVEKGGQNVLSSKIRIKFIDIFCSVVLAIIYLYKNMERTDVKVF